MTSYLLLPFVAGVSIILQAGLNRYSSTQLGLLSAVLLNSLVFFLVSLAIWILVKKGMMPVPQSLAIQPVTEFKAWWLIPGTFGFLIVLCIPLGLQYLPASIVFGLSIATQLVMSVAWDYFTAGIVPTVQKIIGLCVLFVGSLLMVT